MCEIFAVSAAWVSVSAAMGVAGAEDARRNRGVW